MDTDTYNVVIGKITSSVGLKGEVKVWPYTDFPEHLKELADVCVGPEKGDCRILKIERVRLHKSTAVVKLAGVESIDAAEALRGQELRIPESELAPLEEGEFFVHDIIGLDVVTTEGEHLGTVREVLRSPANDVYVTERAMIPAVKEFVVSIDLDRKQMVVKPVEGLIQE